MATATATVATAPFGGAAGRETEGRRRAESEVEERGGRGEVRGVHSRVGKRRKAGGGAGACRRAANTRLASFWREVGGDWHRPAGLGRLLGRTGEAR